MLSDKDAVATVAVKNLESARKFYEQTLGLTKVMENTEVLAFKSGRSTLFVYRSQFAGTNKATAVTWVTDEVEDVVKTLKSRGVSFEHYDLPSMTRQGDLHVAGPVKTAWYSLSVPAEHSRVLGAPVVGWVRPERAPRGIGTPLRRPSGPSMMEG